MDVLEPSTYTYKHLCSNQFKYCFHRKNIFVVAISFFVCWQRTVTSRQFKKKKCLVTEIIVTGLTTPPRVAENGQNGNYVTENSDTSQRYGDPRPPPPPHP